MIRHIALLAGQLISFGSSDPQSYILIILIARFGSLEILRIYLASNTNWKCGATRVFSLKTHISHLMRSRHVCLKSSNCKNINISNFTRLKKLIKLIINTLFIILLLSIEQILKLLAKTSNWWRHIITLYQKNKNADNSTQEVDWLECNQVSDRLFYLSFNQFKICLWLKLSCIDRNINNQHIWEKINFFNLCILEK